MYVISIGLLANKLHLDALHNFNNDAINEVKKISYKSIRTLMPFLEKNVDITYLDDEYHDVLLTAKSLQKILELVKDYRIVNGVEEKGLKRTKEIVDILENQGRLLAI